MIFVKIPRLGQTMQEGTITAWHKDEGDYVEKGEILFEVESDKSNMEIEAQDSGYLKKIILEEYTTAPVGEIAAVLGEKDEEINWEEIKEKSDMIKEIEKEDNDSKKEKESTEELEEDKSAEKNKTIKALPRARKLAEEEGVFAADLRVPYGAFPGDYKVKVKTIGGTEEEMTTTFKLSYLYYSSNLNLMQIYFIFT